MNKRSALLGFLCIPLMAQADIYKCFIDGKTVYSDSKCATDAEKLDIVVDPVDNQNAENLKRQAQTAPVRVEQPKAALGNNPKKIQLLEAEIEKLNQQMEAELAPLRKRRQHVGDNKSVQRGLDEQMDAITRKYQEKIADDQMQLEQLRSQ